MKITIDTKEDSHEEIEHALSLLKSLVGKKVYTNSPNIFDSGSNVVGSEVVDDVPATEQAAEPASGNIFGNMFGDSSAASSSAPASAVETIEVVDES